MIRFLKSTFFILTLIISLTAFSISTTIWALSLASQVTVLSANATAQAVKNRRQIAKIAAKARLRRIVAIVPFAGIAAVGYFEDQDRREWLEANPDKTNADYACELAELTGEVMDEVLSELPMEISLPNWAVPECPNNPET
ncbi:hypothetical protein SAMN05444003_3316 [Cognatiyoonia sediminum]|uniref:Uncharacterized protein n=1 Tax=Cognatiyoonia sediminum TaxID=1508389 RepID=A0A1M5TBR7_9RHOB|nr:hypothetical protein [Cognatiyoonia sediminum]SHH48154.1 hypothetical protein SAMN05444003_3316 [Cognatiyoonia sediminum]